MKANNALQTVGYQEFFGYFDGQYDINEAVRLLKRNTRRYAKRQLTWFKRDSDIRWFATENFKGILETLDGE
jgi:tRNA dimethylallyltransferase